MTNKELPQATTDDAKEALENLNQEKKTESKEDTPATAQVDPLKTEQHSAAASSTNSPGPQAKSLADLEKENSLLKEQLEIKNKIKQTELLGGRSQTPVQESNEDKIKRENNEYLKGTGLTLD